MTAPTQNARVLAALRKAGPAGVKTADFLAPDVIDGGEPVIRLPARVNDLREAGHVIVTHREPNQTARYVLLRDAEDVASALRSATAERPRQDAEAERADLTLWDVPPQMTVRTAYDPWDGDA
jgi:hypothetical protein